jgi:hypothetical protein
MRTVPFTLLSTVAATAALTAACGGSSKPDTVGNRGDAARAPALVYIGWGVDSVFEVDCYDPSGSCAAIRAQALAGGELVSGDGRFKLIGPRKEECGASGDVADVIGYQRVAGPEDSGVGIAAFPVDAAIDLVRTPRSWGEDEPVRPSVSDDLRARVAARATADLAGSDRARTITAGELIVDQVIEGNLTGGPAVDLLIAANLPLPDADGPGYVWSGLVLIPDGDLAAATTLWQSDLETFWIDAHYDLDGDGRRELVFTAAYYEGTTMGAAAVVDGKLVFGATVSCGA